MSKSAMETCSVFSATHGLENVKQIVSEAVVLSGDWHYNRVRDTAVLVIAMLRAADLRLTMDGLFRRGLKEELYIFNLIKSFASHGSESSFERGQLCLSDLVDWKDRANMPESHVPPYRKLPLPKSST